MSQENLKYTKEHEWIKLDGEICVIGITSHAQEALGDITFVESPAVGDQLAQDDICGSIESVKAVSEIFCPVSGEVTEINEELEDSPEFINEDPFGKGWIFKLKIEKASDLDELLDLSAYEALIENE